MTVPWSRYYELARLSRAAYAGPIRHTIYTYDGTPFREQKIVHGAFGRGYCRLFWNDSYLVIAFRGTRESVDWSISNLKAFPVSLRDCADARSVKVHRGFQRTLDYGDKTTRLRSLDSINEHLEEFALLDRRISITGHSLGGALAILYATKFRAKWPDICERRLIEVVTFGSPAVGLQSFKKYYGDLAMKTVRIINRADCVPFTPPLFYCHVGTEIWLRHEANTTDVGWLTRLHHAVRSPFSLSSDHSMSEYLAHLKKEIPLVPSHNKQMQPTQ